MIRDRHIRPVVHPIALAILVMVSASAEVRAAPSSSVHILLVIDTNASKRGGDHAVMSGGMNANLKLVRTVIDEVYGAEEGKFKDRLYLDVLQGDDVTPEKIRAYYSIKRHPWSEGRTLVFYYCGHGAWDKKKGHYFAMSGGDLLRSEVYQLMNDLGPKLIVMASDCCSSYATFQPPARRVPAKWKVFYNLFYESEGVVDFTGATESQFGWINGRDGGFFTRALTNYLCEPSENIRFDGEAGVVKWDDFFRRVRASTESIFDKAKAASPPDAEIKKADAQTPQAFTLAEWRTQYRRKLIVKNNTRERLCVWVQYFDLNFTNNEWQWYYPTDKTRFYEVAPGVETALNHDTWQIGAHRMRIWANSLDSTRVWVRGKDQDIYLAPKEGYKGPFSRFVYSFE